jgi:beta-propeller uncharacterized protein DUF5122
MRKIIAMLLAVTVGTLPWTQPGWPASADIRQDRVVSEDPVDWTPHVLDGTVRAIVVVGDKVVVGGNFTQVQAAPAGSPVLARSNLFAYDATTGTIDPNFTPVVDSVIYALAPGDGGTVYAGGAFKTINGTAVRSLARLRLSDGTVDPGFSRSKINFGLVFTLARSNNHLYVGGTIDTITDTTNGAARHQLARLNTADGAIDTAFAITIAAPRAGTLNVKQLAVDPAETKLLIDGTFTQVNGQPRHQIAMINLTGTPALSSWATDEYNDTCNTVFDTYLRDIDFSPDGDYFIVVTTGGPYGTTTLCDSAARWETTTTGPNQKPTWTNYTGGDTLLSASATGAAVYVGGHQRWMNNPQGNDNAGPGAVERPGIAALDPTTGTALPWNPTRTRGHGVETLIATPTGLLLGSDTDELGHEYHARLGMFPLP